MPQIDIRGDGLDGLWLNAVMLYPNDADKELRKQLYAIEKITNEIRDLSGDQQINISIDHLRLLLSAESPKSILEEAVKRTKRAVIAGDLLVIMYLMDRLKLPEPSLKKAIHVMQEYAKTSSYGDGSQLPTSGITIRKYWEEFLPVAHLWAALRISYGYSFATEGKFFSAKILPHALAAAQGIFLFATNFVPLRARPVLPIMSGDELWNLPTSIEPTTLELSQIPDRLMAALKTYEAPKSDAYG